MEDGLRMLYLKELLLIESKLQPTKTKNIAYTFSK